MIDRLSRIRGAQKSAAEASARMQMKLADGIAGMFDSVAEERREHFSRSAEERPVPGSSSRIAAAYANTNALIAGGASLVPGPWGMLTVVPEIALIVRNQIKMIHDIAYANGKEGYLTRELTAGVLITGLGGSAGALLTMQGGKVVVRRAALRAFQRIVTLLAGKVTQQVLRSTLSKYVPLLGAAAMATWSRYMTKRVARTAEDVFSREIEVVDEVVEAEAVAPDVALGVVDAGLPEVETGDGIAEADYVKALVNLITVDGTASPEEEVFVNEILQRSTLSPDERQSLSEWFSRPGLLPVDYDSIARSPGAAVGLIVDLIALAQRDGTFHAAERSYIYRTAAILGVTDSEVDELMP